MGYLCGDIDKCRGFAKLHCTHVSEGLQGKLEKVRLWLICKTNCRVQSGQSRLINYFAVCKRRTKVDICLTGQKKSFAFLGITDLLPFVLKPPMDPILSQLYQIHILLPYLLKPYRIKGCNNIRHIPLVNIAKKESLILYYEMKLAVGTIKEINRVRVLEQGPGNRGKGRLARGRCPVFGEYDNVIHIIFKCSEMRCQILSRKWLNICLNEEAA